MILHISQSMLAHYLPVQLMNCYYLYFVHRTLPVVFSFLILPILLTILDPSLRFLTPRFETLCLAFTSLVDTATIAFLFVPK